MRIVVWNIERGYTPEKTARTLKAIDADVYLLTEVDRNVQRTKRVDVFTYLKEELGLAGCFAREFKEQESLLRYVVRTGGPGGGEHGAAIFAKAPIENYKIVHLPTNETLAWTGSTMVPELFEPRIGNRIAQICTVRFKGSVFQMVNTHLENWRSSWIHRKAQLETIFDHLDPKLSAIIGGDFNVCERIWKKLFNKHYFLEEENNVRSYLAEKGMFDPFNRGESTFKGYGLSGKLDWVVLPNDMKVVRVENKETDHSDHHCLVVDIEA